MIRLEYPAEKSELVELQFRHIQNSGSATRNRILTALITGILSAGFLYIIIGSFSNGPRWIAALMAGVIGSALSSFGHHKTIRKALAKSIERRYGNDLPCPTIYTIAEGRVTCRMMEVDVSFPLATLKNITEDSEYLELDFGNPGLCLLPLSAFDSTGSKNHFIAALRGTNTPTPT